MRTVVVLFILLFVHAGASAQNWRDTLKMARSAYDKQDYKKAIKLYEKAQKGAPENIDLSDEMAQSAYKSEDYKLAEKIYQQSQGNKSGKKAKANNYHNLGNARMKSENYQAAIDSYKEALRLNPNDEETRYNLSEAKRKLQKQNKSNKSQQQQQQQNQNNNNNGGGGQDQNNNSGQQQNADQSNNQNSSQNNSGNNNSSSKQGNGNQRNNGSDRQNGNNQGQLSDKTAERMLEDLLKREAETKRRMSGGRSGGGKAKSGKDW